MERCAIRDNSSTAPNCAALHPDYALFDCEAIEYLFIVALTKSLFAALAPGPQDTWCGSRHTLSVLSASSLAKEPHCSQTCRKCVWSIDGDN
jgi:hypothetical protein